MHPLPPVLQPGPGSPNVIIGYKLAWRAIPTAAAAAIQAAKQAADIAVQTAVAATAAAAGTPGAPAAYAAEQTTKATTLASMSSTISGAAAGADIHMCVTPSPIPPHGPGVVIDGSPTVLINRLPASRMGDTIIEPLGPPNKIVMGEPTVIIGQTGRGAPVSAPKSSGAGAVSPTQGSGAMAKPAASDAAAQSELSPPPPPLAGVTSSGGVPNAAQALTNAAADGSGLIECAPG